jgi:hypothetical protein
MVPDSHGALCRTALQRVVDDGLTTLTPARFSSVTVQLLTWALHLSARNEGGKHDDRIGVPSVCERTQRVSTAYASLSIPPLAPWSALPPAPEAMAIVQAEQQCVLRSWSA